MDRRAPSPFQPTRSVSAVIIGEPRRRSNAATAFSMAPQSGLKRTVPSLLNSGSGNGTSMVELSNASTVSTSTDRSGASTRTAKPVEAPQTTEAPIDRAETSTCPISSLRSDASASRSRVPAFIRLRNSAFGAAKFNRNSLALTKTSDRLSSSTVFSRRASKSKLTQSPSIETSSATGSRSILQGSAAVPVPETLVELPVMSSWVDVKTTAMAAGEAASEFQ